MEKNIVKKQWWIIPESSNQGIPLGVVLFGKCSHCGKEGAIVTSVHRKESKSEKNMIPICSTCFEQVDSLKVHGQRKILGSNMLTESEGLSKKVLPLNSYLFPRLLD